MSERFFDDVARTLARPMPRRRALRLIGAALTTTATAALWPRSARSNPPVNCPSGSKPCERGCCGEHEICCPKGDGVHAACCLEGQRCCHDEWGRAACCGCTTGFTECGDDCCPEGFLCGGSAERRICVYCPSRQVCGSFCCQDDEECVKKRCIRKCSPGERRCDERCCVERTERCVNGECRPKCDDDEIPCGEKCCQRGEVCVGNSYCRKCGGTVTAKKATTIHLIDGSSISMEKGAVLKLDPKWDVCDDSFTLGLGKIWAKVKKAVAGGDAKFQVATDRAVIGVRGTEFWMSYNRAKQLTKVGVKEGVVELRGRNGAKGRILVKAGQVGMQQGKKRPRLVKR